MVRWIGAQTPGSPISGAIERAAQSLWGDTLTPALKKEQLLKAQRENAGAQNMMDLFRDVGGAAAGRPRPMTPMSASAPGPRVAPSPVPASVDPANPVGIAHDAMLTLGKPTRYDMSNVSEPAQAAFFDLANTWGEPLDVTSAFRSPEHNAAVGGAKHSQHTHGNAFDVSVAGMPLERRNELIARARESGFQGIGVYDNALHFDVGPERAWGPDYHRGSLPSWSEAAVEGQYLPPATPSGMDGAPATDGTYNPLNAAQFYGELAARAVEGGMDPQDAADLARLFMSGTFGAENQATTDAFVGAGGDYGKTYSGFSADQNRLERDSVRDNSTTMRGQDLDYDLGVYKDENDTLQVIRDGRAITIRKQDMLPTDEAILSDTEVKGLTAQGLDMTRDEKAAYVGAEPKTPPTADSYVTGDGTIFRSYDGVNDVSGEPLPPDALKTSVVSADRASAGLDKINARNLEGQVLAGQKFKGTIARARDVAAAAGPTAFGIIGRARSLGQDVQAAIDAAGSALGGDFEATIVETEADIRTRAEQGDPVARTFFAQDYDPNITKLEMYARLLPYEAASAIADQTGRGLSDNDVKRFQQIVGDPLSFFGTQQSFLTTLDTIEAEVDARLGANRATLEGGRDAEIPTGAPVQINSDAEYDALPSGSEFIAPDGSRRRKP